MRLCNHVYKARVTIETRTPLVLATGQAAQGFDNELIRDANGLPIVPGTSLAGVMRHLLANAHGDEWTDRLFGYAGRGTQGANEGEATEGETQQASKIKISMAHCLNSNGKLIDGLTIDADDPVVSLLLEDQPVLRDRVRITHRGSAADKGKFEVVAIPKGARFLFEITLSDSQANDAEWAELLASLANPGFRLGAGTRAGYGAVSILSVGHKHFVLTEQSDAAAYRSYPHSLAEEAELEPFALTGPVSPWALLTLNFEGGVRIGDGTEFFGDPPKDVPEALCYSEQVIDWRTGKGDVLRQLVFPASGIKGALSHRVDYHYRRLSGQYAEELAGEYGFLPEQAARSRALACLFGEVETHAEEMDKAEGNAGSQTHSNEAGARAGKLIFDDVFLDPAEQGFDLRIHNSIDRFTGGTRSGVLFDEQVLWRPSITMPLRLDEKTVSTLPADVLQALKCALEDLAGGSLALGAGSAKGHGFATGTIAWREAS